MVFQGSLYWCLFEGAFLERMSLAKASFYKLEKSYSIEGLWRRFFNRLPLEKFSRCRRSLRILLFIGGLLKYLLFIRVSWKVFSIEGYLRGLISIEGLSKRLLFIESLLRRLLSIEGLLRRLLPIKCFLKYFSFFSLKGFIYRRSLAIVSS